jgi:hypothetical protein
MDIKLEPVQAAIVVKALQAFSQAKVRQQAKEIPGTPMRELLNDQVAEIDTLTAKFR